MPGGKGNINGNDGVKFSDGNKAAEKWTEQAALKFGEDLLTWFKAEDENIFTEDFILLKCNPLNYASKPNVTTISYLRKKFSSFSNLIEECKEIEKLKLKKFGAFDKLNPQIVKFLLSAEFGLREKSDITTKDEKITQPHDLSKLSPEELSSLAAIERKIRE